MSQRPDRKSKALCHSGIALVAGVALSSALLATPVLADTVLRPSRDLDIQRTGGIGADEKRLLRVEWKAGFTHDQEMSLIGDMLSRLGRMQVTVDDLRRTIEKMPGGPAPAGAPSGAPAVPVAASPAVPTPVPAAAPRPKPAPMPDDDDEPAPSAIGLNLQTGLAGGALALLVGFWLLRRRQAGATVPAPAPRPAPAARSEKQMETPLPATPVIAPPLPEEAKAEPAAPPAVPAPVTPDAAPTAEAEGGGEQQALELAEIMLSMGLASGAAQALTEQIQANPKQALYHWLKLLDVYRKSGNKFQFEQASRELQQHFNVQAETWAQMHEGQSGSLESFTRIISHIQGIWNQPGEAIAYLKHLLEDNRGGTRAGFPQPVAEEILLLVAILKETWGRS